MKLDTKNWSFWLSILSLSVVIFCLIFCLPRIITDKEYGFDYMGVIVGVLAILVTLMLGWNLFTLFDFKEKINKAELDYDELKERITKANGLANDTNVSTNYALYLIFKESSHYAGAITALIQALAVMADSDFDEYHKMGEFDKFSKYLSELMNNLDNCNFGENNINILEKNMKKIRENKKYHFVRGLLEDSFNKIDYLILPEKK